MQDFEEFDLLKNVGERCWRDAEHILPRLGPYWASWLLDMGSLTQRLKTLSKGDFRVELVEQRWVSSSRAVLLEGLSANEAKQRLWSRKVVLMCAGEPCIAAHTLIPVCSIQGPLRKLRKLGSKPLGESLFREPDIERGGMKVCAGGSTRGRYSVFRLHGYPVLVAEFYLPGLRRVEDKMLDRSKLGSDT